MHICTGCTRAFCTLNKGFASIFPGAEGLLILLSLSAAAPLAGGAPGQAGKQTGDLSLLDFSQRILPTASAAAAAAAPSALISFLANQRAARSRTARLCARVCERARLCACACVQRAMLPWPEEQPFGSSSPLGACLGTPPRQPLLACSPSDAGAGSHLAASLICMRGTRGSRALSPRHNRSCLPWIPACDQAGSAEATVFPSGCSGRQTGRAGRMRGCEAGSMPDPGGSLPFSCLLFFHPRFPLSEAGSDQHLPALPGPQRGFNNSPPERGWEPDGPGNAARHRTKAASTGDLGSVPRGKFHPGEHGTCCLLRPREPTAPKRSSAGGRAAHWGVLATKSISLHLPAVFAPVPSWGTREALTLAPGAQTRRMGAAAGPDLGFPLLHTGQRHRMVQPSPCFPKARSMAMGFGAALGNPAEPHFAQGRHHLRGHLPAW